MLRSSWGMGTLLFPDPTRWVLPSVQTRSLCLGRFPEYDFVSCGDFTRRLGREGVERAGNYL